MFITEITSSTHADFAAAGEVYSWHFGGMDTGVPMALIGAAIDAHAQERAAHPEVRREFTHHLWALREREDGPVCGMTTFFALRDFGYGGYLVLEPSVRGKGMLRALLAQIEECMRADRPGLNCWFIECEPGEHAEAAFRHLGFHVADVAYVQPAIPVDAEGAQGSPVPQSLLFKAFGAQAGPSALTVADARAALAQLFETVYRMEEPEYRTYVEGALQGLGRGERLRWR